MEDANVGSRYHLICVGSSYEEIANGRPISEGQLQVGHACEAAVAVRSEEQKKKEEERV